MRPQTVGNYMYDLSCPYCSITAPKDESSVVESDEYRNKAYLFMWDFCGDTYLYNAQHIFLNSNAVFLIVFNMAKCLENRDNMEKSLENRDNMEKSLENRKKNIGIVLFDKLIDFLKTD